MGVSAPAPSILATVKGAKTIMVSGLENTFIDKTCSLGSGLVRSDEGIRAMTDLREKSCSVRFWLQ